MRIISERISAFRSISLGFWVGIGSRDETPEQAGITHFVEHLLFKGTKKRTAKDIAETFDAIGGELNALSSKEYTFFYAKVLDQYLPLAVDVLTDILMNPIFKKTDIAAERRVVLEEINMHEDSPADLIHDYFDSELWHGHPLGKRVLGSAKTIRAITRDDIASYFRQSYVPPNIVVAAAGNVRHNMLIDLMERSLGKIEGRKIPRARAKPEVKSHTTVFRRKTQQAHICYGTEGLPLKHKDRFVLAILDTILGGGMSSRLFQNIREKRGLVYSIYSFNSQFTETGAMAIYAGTQPSKAKEVIKLIETEIEEIVQNGVTEIELVRAREHLKGSLVLSLEDTSTRMSRLGRAEITRSEILSVDDLIKRIDAVTLEDISRLTKRIFKPDKMVLTVIGPFKKEAFETKN